MPLSLARPALVTLVSMTSSHLRVVMPLISSMPRSVIFVPLRFGSASDIPFSSASPRSVIGLSCRSSCPEPGEAGNVLRTGVGDLCVFKREHLKS